MNIRNRVKEIRTVRLKDIRPNPRNWRTHPGAQADALRGVLSEVGWAGVVLAYEPEDGGGLMYIDGHLREEVVPDMEAQVAVLDVTDAEADYLLATHDPLTSLATANASALDELIAGIETNNAAVREMLDALAAEHGINVEEKPGEITEDEAPEPTEDPISKPGDLWLLGDHRLLCGDSKRPDDVNRVMGGERATLVFTDPPYGVAIAAKNRMLNTFQKAGRCLEDIEDDSLSPADLKAKLLPAFKNIHDLVMADDCTVFVTAPQGGELGMMMMMMMQEARLRPRHVLIWKKNKPTFSMGRLDYDYQHEPILLTWGKRHKRPMQGAHRTSVWEIDKPRESKLHPTMKPVALVANALLNNSDKGDISFDAYCGSGTSVIAAEQTGRRCRAIEISPAYCDVIVKRWEALTGKTATRET